MTSVDIIVKFANELYIIALSIACLLGLGFGALFWVRVLRG